MLNATKRLLNSLQCPFKTSVRNNPFPVSFMQFLENLAPMETSSLMNGLKIVTQRRPCNHVSVGVFVDAGPRYENDFEHGITHFFEHIVFTSTYARTKAVLETQMDCTGAKYKCFTTREMAVYYAECLCEDLALTVDVLTDGVFNNLFDPEEIEKQKKIVYAEMKDLDYDSNALLEDYLHGTAFQGTPLAKTVLGLSSNLHNFNSITIPTYLNRFYDADRTVLVAVGGVEHAQMVALACKYLSKLEPNKCFDTDVYRFTGSEVRYRNDSMPVANVAIAVEGPSMCDDDHVIMEVAANHIGGWDRSQHGGINNGMYVARASAVDAVCDAYKAFNITYKDCSLWGVQFVGPSLKLDDMVYVVQDQWMKMCNMVTDFEIQQAKRALKTKILTRNESTEKTCLDIGKFVLHQGYMDPLRERISAVDRVTAESMRACCYRYIYDKCPAVAAIGPVCGLTDYIRIRAGMYWIRL